MPPEQSVVIEVFGEGKTDVAHGEQPEPPTKGVVPILTHTLCGRPKRMRVKRYGVVFLQTHKGGLRKKVSFAKRQARLNRSAGAVFVVDSDGDLKERLRDLNKGRDMDHVPYPLAIGAAHTCIEAWLLADPAAIARAMAVSPPPNLHEEPEALPAARRDRRHNPKTVLAKAAESDKADLQAHQKWAIATEVRDIAILVARCPLSFAPFADEVERHIRPLFGATG